MIQLDKPFLKDNSGLFYINSKDVELSEFNFNEVIENYSHRRTFYHINGVDDYIIKDTTRLPKFFNKSRNIKLLKNFQLNQDKFSDIDFPVGYFLDKKKVRGVVVPYYKDSKSIKELTNLYKFEDLKNFYLHDDNEKINLINMCLDILEIIKKLYDEDIIYTDIGAGNFVVCNNSVKIIDFEPDYVHFVKKRKRYLSLLLSNYNILVNYIWRHYGYDNTPYSPGETFIDAKYKVKSLINEKKR